MASEIKPSFQEGEKEGNQKKRKKGNTHTHKERETDSLAPKQADTIANIQQVVDKKKQSGITAANSFLFHCPVSLLSAILCGVKTLCLLCFSTRHCVIV